MDEACTTLNIHAINKQYRKAIESSLIGHFNRTILDCFSYFFSKYVNVLALDIKTMITWTNHEMKTMASKFLLRKSMMSKNLHFLRNSLLQKRQSDCW